MNANNHSEYLPDIVQNFDSSFEAMIPIGDPVQINWKGRKYHSVFRGVVALRSILTDIPEMDGKKADIDYNASLTARFLVSGTVYSFKTGLLRLHKNPGLMVLEYPGSITKFNLRRSKRIKVFIPVKVITGWESESSSGETWHAGSLSGAILDLSNRGMLLAVNWSNRLDVGHNVTISMTLPDGSAISSLEGHIKNVRPSAEKLLMGVCFDQKKGDSNRAINIFYRECLSYHEAAGWRE